MKYFFLITISFVLLTNLQAQEINSDKEINDKLKKINEKLLDIDIKNKQISSKITTLKFETTADLKKRENEIQTLKEELIGVEKKVDYNKQQIDLTLSKMEGSQVIIADKMETLRKNFILNLIIISSIILLIILFTGAVLLRLSRKNHRDLVDLKQDVDLEMQSIEKDFIRELRTMRKDMNKITPSAIRYGRAYDEIKQDFDKDIESTREMMLKRIDELKDKIESESRFTIDRFDSEIGDMKKLLFKEIDQIYDQINPQEEQEQETEPEKE